MALTERDIDLIDKYFRQGLSEQEHRVWQEKMQDTAFASHFRDIAAAQDVVRESGRQDLREMMTAWDDEKPRRRRMGALWKISIAAGIALVATFFFLLRPDQETGTQSIASAYLEPYPNVIAPLQKSDSEPTRYDKAFQSYESGRYESALEIFDDLNPNDQAVQFYTALSWMMKGEYMEAIGILNNIISQPEHRFYQPALWYLALAQIETGQHDQARVTLRHVATGPTPFASQAIDLMSKL